MNHGRGYTDDDDGRPARRAPFARDHRAVRRQPRREYYEPEFEPYPESRRGMGIERITVPVVLVLGLSVFMVGASSMVATQIAGMRASIERLDERFTALTIDRWTRADMAVWCSQNRANITGLSCPDTRR